MTPGAPTSRSRVVALAVGAGLTLGAAMFASAPPAWAACHAFDVSVDPANAPEGTSVTVTVSRDGSVNPSSVRVRTVDGTATGGQDYEPVDRRVEFTSGTEQQLTLQILQDEADEPAETFRLELSEGQGCPANPSFRYGSATVTVADDDDPQPTPTAPPPPPGPTTTPPPGATTTAASATTTSTSTADATTSTEGSATSGVPPTVEDDSDDSDDSGGIGPLGVAVAGFLVAAAAAGTYLLYRRYRADSPEAGDGA